MPVPQPSLMPVPQPSYGHDGQESWLVVEAEESVEVHVDLDARGVEIEALDQPEIVINGRVVPWSRWSTWPTWRAPERANA